MIFAAILAGGKGTRVGSNVPKQFLELGGKPILVQTVDVFVQSNLFESSTFQLTKGGLNTQELFNTYFS
jgi:2-C-methyl-D-erythritol 4-phosphate cytidylyltransferase